MNPSIRTLLAVLLVWPLGAGCGSDPPVAGGGGETSWLRGCAMDADCGGLSCLCGVCTTPCADTTACRGLGGDPTCVRAETTLGQRLCSGSLSLQGGICLPGCRTGGACGADQVCLSGACLLGSQGAAIINGEPVATTDGSADPRDSDMDGTRAGERTDADGHGSDPDPANGAPPDETGPDVIKIDGNPTPGLGRDPMTGCWLFGNAGIYAGDVHLDDARPEGVEALRDMHTLVGDLYVEDPDPDQWAAASCLSQIVGNVYLGSREDPTGRRSPQFQSLLDMPTLGRIGGNLRVENNRLLEMIPLSGLYLISGDLVVRNNSGLRDLSGFSSLSYVGGSVAFENNPGLDACEAEEVAATAGTTCTCSNNGPTACP